MKPKDLHSVWSMPDNSRLTAKQYSFRLPVHVAAKLAALCDLYPNKNRTQIVADLLATAIDAAVEGLPQVKGQHIDRIVEPEGTFEIYEDVGPCGRFKEAANAHFRELERELGNEEAGQLYEPNYLNANVEGKYSTFSVGERASE